jgi:multisubunit Na+/H+ antiporter MnhC subunit
MMHIFAITMIIIGFYGVLFKENIIKKVMGLNILTNGINLLLIIIGYRPDGILAIASPSNIDYFFKSAVDPLPQALVLTSIVIDVSVTAFALVLCYQIFKKFKTLKIKEISTQRG